jgi:hypothetical protein
MDVNFKDPKVIALGIRVGVAFANDDWEALKNIAAEAAGVDQPLKDAIDLYIKDPTANYMNLALLVGVRAGLSLATGSDAGTILNAGGSTTTPTTTVPSGTTGAPVSINDAPERHTAQVRQVLQVNPSLRANMVAGERAAAQVPVTLGMPGLAGPKRVGGEGDSYYFPDPTAVAYGAQGKFVVRRVQGNVTFTPALFGWLDPAPNVAKSAYILPQGTYDFVGFEGESHNFTELSDVLYGNMGAYTLRTGIVGNLPFNSETLGDPIKEVTKAAYSLRGGAGGMGKINYKDFMSAVTSLNLDTSQNVGAPTGEGLLAMQSTQASAQQQAHSTSSTPGLFQNASTLPGSGSTTSLNTTQVAVAGGGALAGFFIYGPIGAAVGALAGWLLGKPSTSTPTSSGGTKL